MRGVRALSIVTATLALGASLFVGSGGAGAGALRVSSAVRASATQTQSRVEGYVARVYQDLLGRSPDAGGFTYWTTLLNSGVPRPAVASALVTSDEYRGDVIAGMYQRLLRRSTDAGGLAYWRAQIRAGMTFEQVECLLLASDEYASSKQGNWGFVGAIYNDVLGRPVVGDDAGARHLVDLLATGTPRWQVVAALVFSPEHLVDTVNGYYAHFLHRSGEPGGITYWTGQLRAGHRDETIVALIVASEEYFALSASPPPEPGPPADLVITAISVGPANLQAGQVRDFTATVVNQGAGATPPAVPIYVTFVPDTGQPSWARFQLGGLAPGASVTVDTAELPSGGPWTVTSGAHTISASVDGNAAFTNTPVNLIQESDENNNMRSISFVVP